VVHCGILATILEEVMGNVLVIKAKRLCFTVKLSIKYLEPVLVESQYSARAKIENLNEDFYEVGARIYNQEGEVMVTAKGSYKAISMEQAARAMDIDESAMMEFMTYLAHDKI
jgi:acyl-CoA thioesterase FadM